MASIVHVDPANALGDELLGAIDRIRSGLAKLHELDGRRAQTIAVSPAAFGAAFGIADNADSSSEAQAMSDRLAAIEGGTYTGLPDLLDATLIDLGV